MATLIRRSANILYPSFLRSASNSYKICLNRSYLNTSPTIQTIKSARFLSTHNSITNNPESDTACALCKLNLKNLNYTDVMILSQFIAPDGTLLTYHESRLCTKQYNKVMGLIKRAQRCNLIKRPADYLSPGPWHDLNTYLEPDRRRDQPMKVIKKEYWKI